MWPKNMLGRGGFAWPIKEFATHTLVDALTVDAGQRDRRAP